MASVKLIENGPVIITADEADKESLLIIDDKQTIPAKRIVLCRCRKSEKYPYCDGTHKDLIV